MASPVTDLSDKEQLSQLSYLKIKKKWNEITISDFFLIKEFQEDPNLNELQKRFKKLTLLSGKDDTYFNKFSKGETWALYDCLTFLTEEPKAILKDYYTIGGTKYKRIGVIDDFCYGQFIDLSKYTEEQKLNIDNIHLILSVVLIPVKPITTGDIIYNAIYRRLPKKVTERLRMNLREGITESYGETKIEVTANNVYDNMNIADAMSIFVFFCLLEKIFVSYTKIYFQQETKNKLKSALKSLTGNPAKVKEMNQIQEIMDTLQNGIGLSQ